MEATANVAVVHPSLVVQHLLLLAAVVTLATALIVIAAIPNPVTVLKEESAYAKKENASAKRVVHVARSQLQVLVHVLLVENACVRKENASARRMVCANARKEANVYVIQVNALARRKLLQALVNVPRAASASVQLVNANAAPVAHKQRNERDLV